MMIEPVLSAYGLNREPIQLEPVGNGLINHTWKLTSGGESFVVQQINSDVFKQPENIAHNINTVATYLERHFPLYKFVGPVASLSGERMIRDKRGNYYRVFPFVHDSFCLDVVETAQQAYEAAAQFGRFSKLLSGIDISDLRITIPGFHDLSARYKHFLKASEMGDPARIVTAADLVKKLKGCSGIVTEYENILRNPEFKLRVTHHDTKISNVLLDKDGHGICVIDLDTVMPGYFISDVGDMMRTCLSPVSEEESDFSKVEVRMDFYHAIVDGYYAEMKDELTETEKKYFLYAGEFLVFMQAIRFLTDYLENDVYYGAKYPDQNLVRAGNQVVLLERLFEVKE